VSILICQPRVKRSWSPTSLGSNLYAWFDASDISTLYQDSARTTAVTTNGDPVGSWGDKSGNSRHLSQGTSGSRPTYTSSGTSLSFDGTDDTMTRAMNLGDFTLFLVAKVDSAGSVLVFDLDADATHFAYSVKPSSNTLGIHRGGVSSRAADNASAYSVGTKCCYSFRTQGVSPYYEMRRDQSSQVTITSTPGTDTINGTLYLASYHTAAFYTQGHFHEVVVASTALSDSDRDACENYLKAKWGTP
jgi:hypothetical protein